MTLKGVIAIKRRVIRVYAVKTLFSRRMIFCRRQNGRVICSTGFCYIFFITFCFVC